MPIRPTDIPPEAAGRWQSRRQRVGSRIRELRLTRGMTQEALASAADLSRVHLNRLEAGKRSLAYERLWDLAAALNVNINELLEVDEESQG
ncbi:helix-turn-helix domain-containing protein [Zafaria sp. Z1313]|uniref:helix-turn-helix domain-containing protein n=1 Tax=unclassified Zafaria TaxID=2828765 RepID=UPI002E78A5D0|nr:helix-turn-helix transcriptional regulator [Zafaria sp. J156]MEE1622965.1 helix-turn-helix transcriptional regulator [Zafaria sp. J156]